MGEPLLRDRIEIIRRLSREIRLRQIEAWFINDGSTGSAFGNFTWNPYVITYPTSGATTAPTVTQIDNQICAIMGTSAAVVKQTRVLASAVTDQAMTRTHGGSTPQGLVHTFKNTSASQTVYCIMNYTYLIGA